MRHGFTAYRDGCRCETCRAANTRRVKEYRLKGVQSIKPELVQKHVAKLINSGMSMPQIAKEAGVSLNTINRLVYPRYQPKRILKVNAQKILSVQRIQNPDEIVSAIPSQRRIRALMWMGWKLETIAKESGMSRDAVGKIARRYRTRTKAASHEAIKETYERLCMTYGPDVKTATWARKQRWLPPLAWDDPDDLEEKRLWGETVHWTVQKRKRRAR